MKNDNKLVVLVVEDDRPLHEAIVKKLKLNNFSVKVAISVKQALEYMQKIKKVDAIWLDHYLLGSENGLDFVNTLKSNEATKNIPIFVVSNTASPDKIRTYLRLGVDKYYLKSNSRLEDIVNEMKKILK